jgi:hypothetical protein
MLHYYLRYLSACLLSMCIVFSACQKRTNGIVNNQVIETPYSLFFADTAGTLLNTNNGDSINKIAFYPDGFPTRAICVADTNLIFIKRNLYLSFNNTNQFNHAYDSVPSYPLLAVNNLPFDLNQSMILNAADESRVYVVSVDPSPTNYLGVAYSLKNGILGSYILDTLVDSSVLKRGGSTITSLTELTNNVLIGYDAVKNRVFYKTSATTPWYEDTTNNLPVGGWFSLGHYNNQVIAIDNSGRYGAWYSNDQGATWTQFTGLPANRPLLCVASPFDQVLLVGTDSAGVYILNTNTGGAGTFQSDNYGLDNYVVVRGIASKQNLFKNNTNQEYIYLATNHGIYQSVDRGQHWIKHIVGNFVAIY